MFEMVLGRSSFSAIALLSGHCVGKVSEKVLIFSRHEDVSQKGV